MICGLTARFYIPQGSRDTGPLDIQLPFTFETYLLRTVVAKTSGARLVSAPHQRSVCTVLRKVGTRVLSFCIQWGDILAAMSLIATDFTEPNPARGETPARTLTYRMDFWVSDWLALFIFEG